MDDNQVWLAIIHEGEYSDYSCSCLGVFTTPEAAKQCCESFHYRPLTNYDQKKPIAELSEWSWSNNAYWADHGPVWVASTPVDYPYTGQTIRNTSEYNVVPFPLNKPTWSEEDQKPRP